MLDLGERSRRGDRKGALEAHLAWLLSAEIAEGSDIPFRREAATFRSTFDELIRVYDAAMTARSEIAVRGRGEG